MMKTKAMKSTLFSRLRKKNKTQMVFQKLLEDTVVLSILRKIVKCLQSYFIGFFKFVKLLFKCWMNFSVMLLQHLLTNTMEKLFFFYKMKQMFSFWPWWNCHYSLGILKQTKMYRQCFTMYLFMYCQTCKLKIIIISSQCELTFQ